MENNRRKSFLVGGKMYAERELFQAPQALTNIKKSILKPCTLRRSMSLSNDVNQKKVAFTGPQCIVDVDFIDEKMKRSYIEDKSTDLMGHRRRSFTVPNNTNYFAHKIPIRAVPNFKALHEQEFNKMESLTEHTQRKAERAKKLLATPSSKSVVEKSHFVRNSETRTPVMKRPAIIPYVGPPSKIPKISASHTDNEKKRASLNSVNFIKKESPITRIFSKFTGTDRKSLTEKKLSLTSSAASPTTTERQQLKGVRLNKRFQLQMAHQQVNPQLQSR